MAKITKKNIKAHERCMERLAQETIEPKRLPVTETNSGQPLASFNRTGRHGPETADHGGSSK